MSGFSPEVRRIVERRSGGMCERCHDRQAVDVHHRRPRGLGGTSVSRWSEATNAAALCRPCHQWAETYRQAAEDTGWRISLHSTADPGQVPVTDTRGQTWVYNGDAVYPAVWPWHR